MTTEWPVRLVDREVTLRPLAVSDHDDWRRARQRNSAWLVPWDATVRTTDRTGVEMEALTAVSVAALTVIDMVKAVDKAAVITDVRVESKSGGRSGDWSR